MGLTTWIAGIVAVDDEENKNADLWNTKGMKTRNRRMGKQS